MTTQENLYITFKDHCIGRKNLTKKLMAEARKKDTPPQIFSLEYFEGTKATCFSRLVAWGTLLHENGYLCVNGDTFNSYLYDFEELTKQFYEEIKSEDVVALLNDDKSLFPKYEFKKENNGEKKGYSITITLSKEDYEYIEQCAEKTKMTKTNYTRQMALNGEIIVLETPVDSEYLKEIRELNGTLQQCMIVIYRLGQYFPKDMQKIQSATDLVKDHYRSMLDISIKLSKKIQKYRKTRRNL